MTGTGASVPPPGAAGRAWRQFGATHARLQRTHAAGCWGLGHLPLVPSGPRGRLVPGQRREGRGGGGQQRRRPRSVGAAGLRPRGSPMTGETSMLAGAASVLGPGLVCGPCPPRWLAGAHRAPVVAVVCTALPARRSSPGAHRRPDCPMPAPVHRRWAAGGAGREVLRATTRRTTPTRTRRPRPKPARTFENTHSVTAHVHVSRLQQKRGSGVENTEIFFLDFVGWGSWQNERGGDAGTPFRPRPRCTW